MPPAGFMRCPTCGRTFEAITSSAKPFCSDRCRQIDLARWLGEEFSVPVLRREEDEDELPGEGEARAT